ncbi:MAG: CPBP family intramembrane metalloprotease [Bryobacterales bacterium]|nr:CPBP family intramembrane metalloprotease [Bryobacterales bacterium]
MLPFRRVLIILWFVGALAAYFYAHQQHIPPGIAVPVAAAFLVELSLFLGMNRIVPPTPWALAGTAVAPYLIYSLPAGTFRLPDFLQLMALAAIAAWWLSILRNRPWADWLFFAFLAAVYLAKPFKRLYLSPVEDLRVDALGQLMWFRVAITSWLTNRPRQHAGFGFIPTRRDWLLGLRYFALFLPAGILLVWALRFATFRLAPDFWWKGPATFLGIFLVVALAEEFFFRGILLESLRKPLGATAALMISSAVFGSAHLWFGDFPNWRFAILAGTAGLFYGGAYLASGGIRAAMVTHALVVAVWRTLLRS